MNFILTILCLITVITVFVEAQSPEQKSKFKAWTVSKRLRLMLNNSTINFSFTDTRWKN